MMIDPGWPPPRRHIVEVFSARAPTYDRSVMHQWLAESTAARMRPAPGSIVLDVAAGTGLLCRAIAKAVPSATFIAIDITEAMLRAADSASLAVGVPLLSVVADGSVIPLRDRSVDWLGCVSALPYFRDPRRTLAEWKRVLRPDGRLVFQYWREGTMFETRILQRVASGFGLVIDDPNAPLGTEARCSALLAELGLGHVEIASASMEHTLPDGEATWAGLRRSGFRPVLDRLDQAGLGALGRAFVASYEQARYSAGGSGRYHTMIVSASA